MVTKQLDQFASEILAPATGLQLVKGTTDKSSTSHSVQVAASRNATQYEDGATGGPFNGGIGTKRGSYTMPAISFSLSK